MKAVIAALSLVLVMLSGLGLALLFFTVPDRVIVEGVEDPEFERFRKGIEDAIDRKEHETEALDNLARQDGVLRSIQTGLSIEIADVSPLGDGRSISMRLKVRNLSGKAYVVDSPEKSGVLKVGSKSYEVSWPGRNWLDKRMYIAPDCPEVTVMLVPSADIPPEAEIVFEWRSLNPDTGTTESLSSNTFAWKQPNAD
ncbi:MAG: hypothetical protein Kow00107_03220 [Planctomycetota bacterium]